MADPVIVNPTRHRLKRSVGGRDGRYPFLELLTMDIAEWKDDFMGDTLHGSYQSTANGTAAAAAAINTGNTNGEIRLDAGSDDNGRSDLSLGLHFLGDNNATIACRLHISVITTVKVEMGFTDVISGTDAGAVNVKATPSFTAADCCVWCIDTDDNANWEGMGNAAGTAATTDEAAISPVADTDETLIVTTRDGSAKYIRLDANGLQTYETAGYQLLAVTETTRLTPWIFVQNRSAAQHVVDVDFLWAWQRRTIN